MVECYSNPDCKRYGVTNEQTKWDKILDRIICNPVFDHVTVEVIVQAVVEATVREVDRSDRPTGTRRARRFLFYNFKYALNILLSHHRGVQRVC